MAEPERLVVRDLEAISHEAAKRFASAAQKAITARGRSLAVLTGGRTSKRTYELLALPPYRNEIPWEKVHIFLSDERFLPFDHPENNFGAIRKILFSKVPLPQTNLHPFLVEASSPEKAAQKTESAFRHFFGETALPRFDFMFLGMGADGHVAGLFPGSLAFKTEIGLVAFSEKTGGFDRLSFTLPVLNASREIVFLAAGEEKSKTVATILNHRGGHLPAGSVNPKEGKVLWLLDEGAALFLDDE